MDDDLSQFAPGDQFLCLSDWVYTHPSAEDPHFVIDRLCVLLARIIDTLPPPQRRMVLADFNEFDE